MVGVGGKKVMKGTPRDEVALRPGRGGSLSRCRRILAAARPGRQKTGPKAEARRRRGARLNFGRGETVCHAPGISQMVPKREFQFPEWEVFSNGERILII